jgi:hypothetical protein
MPKPPRGPTLKLTPVGPQQDILGTWRRRCKKGSTQTVINERQYLAGRAVERRIDDLVGRGPASVDLTVPAVDRSFEHRLGGNPVVGAALAWLKRLGGHIGKRDLEFVMAALGGMGIFGAMLREAGHEWRCPPDRDGPVGEASGILAKRRSCSIEPEFADASTGKSGNFDVFDREKERPVHSRHKVPRDTGIPDQGELNEKAARSARREAVAISKAELAEEAKIDAEGKDYLPADLLDAFSVAARALKPCNPDLNEADDEAIRLMGRKPPPDITDGGPRNSIASTVADYGFYEPWQTKQRAVHLFGVHKIELASKRVRDVLTKIADFIEQDAAAVESYEPALPQSASPQIAQREDVPFDVGVEDGEFVEIEPATSKK